jgi:pimeloyl-ACP methyl ester carboxylesterase
MKTKINRDYFEIEGSDKRSINMDVHHVDSEKPQPIAIFAHGYKGFKDFGVWSIIGDEFARNGIVFVRFNFSHNGVTPETPIDFSDLDAFGQNNFTKEIYDFSQVINFIYGEAINNEGWDQDDISIIGHSRGGGMAILTAGENEKVKKLITWAAIESTSLNMPEGEQLEYWRNNGVAYVTNGRTKQEMPHYFQFYQDYEQNLERLNIQGAIENIDIPVLIFHGDNDEAVHVNAARLLHGWAKNSRLEIIEDSNHSFGSKHPWDRDELPNEMKLVVKKSIAFVKSY